MMASTASRAPDSPAKRRRVRKGTRSCWECKRRKIRCMLASPGDVVCVGCQHRGVACVPQDVPEHPFPAKKDSKRRLGEQMALIEQTLPKDSHDYLAGDTRTVLKDARGPTPSPRLLTLNSRERGVATHAVPDNGKTEATRRHLLAALPARKDLDMLLRETCRPSRYTGLSNTRPHSALTLERLSAPFPVPEYPRADAHPVVLARLLLTLAITLQTPSGEKAVPCLSEPAGVLMRRLVAAARTRVTADEDMHGSLDCLVCIVLEGVYEINCGSLRRAWAVFRRAMAAAQLMGLHRSPVRPLVPRIDPSLDADPQFLWFRIVYMDRFLSLLLGLPQGTGDKSMAAASALRDQPPLGRFERQLTVAASRILERNERAFGVGVGADHQVATVQSIDAELLAISRGMPPDFWRLPSFQNLELGAPETFLETNRLAAQVYYHGLLIQLHLPYMMRVAPPAVGASPSHEYSKVTCATSSREILARFVAHRTFNLSSSCSRPVDFFALLAAMTLLLAHLDAHHLHRRSLLREDGQPPNLLAHQRLGDRAMLDQALERMAAIKNIYLDNHANRDAITERSTRLIRQLMEIEADAAQGASYTTIATATATLTGADPKAETDGGADDDGGLLLTIPHLGVVRIARQAGPTVSREPLPSRRASSGAAQQQQPQPQQLGQQQAQQHSRRKSGSWEQHLTPPHYTRATYEGDPVGLREGLLEAEPAALAGGEDDWVLQGVDMAFFDGLMRGITSGPEAGTSGLQLW